MIVLPFLPATAIQDLVERLRTEANTIAGSMCILGLMMLGYHFMFRPRHQDANVGGFLIGGVCMLGAAGLVRYFLPSAGA